MNIELIVFFVLYVFFVCMSFFFSGNEAGYLSLNRNKFEMDKNKNMSAIRIKKYVYNLDYLLLLLLFGNNLSNILVTYLSHIIGKSYFMENYTNFIGIWVNLITVIILFTFGEVLPKLLFKTYSNVILYKTSIILRFFDFIFYPMIFLLRGITKVLLFVFRNKSSKLLLSREDISNIIDDSNETGLINFDEAYLLETFSSISKTRVMEVMTPVADLVLIEKNEKINDYLSYFKKKNETHMFVYSDRIDNIIGYITVSDVFNSSKKRKIAKDFLIKTQYIPSINTLDDVYNRFSNTDVIAFIIVDEYGGCCGVISQRRLVDRLYGFSYKMKSVKSDINYIKKINSYSYEMDTIVDIDDFNRIFDLNILKDGYETVAGLLYFLFGYIPKDGYSTEYKGISFTIKESTERSVDKVIVEFSKEKYNFEKKKIQFFEEEKN